jgi:hypothetical protein
LKSLRIMIVLLGAAGFVFGPGGSGAAAASTPAAVSANWAGYAVTGAKYRRVTGTWIEPKGRCTAGGSTSSAIWVGLGGFAQSSEALEQVGTELDCTSSGQAEYSAWYELVPAASVTIPLKIRAGDRLSASVTVVRTQVTLVLHDETTGRRFAKTLHMPVAPDVASAEWILEAPSACTRSGNCQILPLADFGAMRFSHAAATSTGGHTGTPGHRAWASTVLTMSDGAGSAVPSGLASSGSSFTVTYQQGAVAPGSAKRTLPASVHVPWTTRP